MPFTLATKEVGFVKGSFFGPGGMGKTTLLASPTPSTDPPLCLPCAEELFG